MGIPMYTDIKRKISRKFCGLFYGINRKSFLLEILLAQKRRDTF